MRRSGNEQALAGAGRRMPPLSAHLKARITASTDSTSAQRLTESTTANQIMKLWLSVFPYDSGIPHKTNPRTDTTKADGPDNSPIIAVIQLARKIHPRTVMTAGSNPRTALKNHP